MIKSTSCEDFKSYVGSKVWLPQKCVMKCYVSMPEILTGFTEYPCQIHTITLNAAAFDEAPPSDVSFRLDFGPGTVMSDRSTIAAEGRCRTGRFYLGYQTMRRPLKRSHPKRGQRNRSQLKRSQPMPMQRQTSTPSRELVEVATRGRGRGMGSVNLRSNIFRVAGHPAVREGTLD